MKTLYLSVCMAVSAISFAQQESQVLDQNNTAAFITNRGTIFYNFDLDPAGYEVPKGSGLHTISGAKFWFAGTDINGMLHASLGGLDPTLTDVFPGPYSTTNNYSNSDNWKVWEICQSEIDNFIVWFNATLPGADTSLTFVEPSAETMQRLFSWPGNGDVNAGQNYRIAPFYDRDQNGIYDVTAGDYPIIKGCCATYMVQNDAAGPHSLSSTINIGLEIHYMIYQYESDDYVNDATFIDVMAINRNSVNYSQFAHGFLLDADLGYYNDDLVGSDSITGMLYFYNGDNDDEGFYGQNPPAIGIVSLNNRPSSCAPFTGNPSSGEAWNILNGKQSSGDIWTDPNSHPTNFVYSGNPSVPGAWLDNVPADRRGIMTHFDDIFGTGDTIFQSYAILYARSGDNLQNVEELRQQAAAVKLFYANDSLMCSPYTLGISKKEKVEFSVQPNPTDGLITIKLEAAGKTQLTLLQANGTVVLSKESDQKQSQLDLSGLPKGLYFLKIDSEKGSKTEKIILQ